MITFLFVMHGLCAIALLGAITHQAAAVWFTSDQDGRRAVWRVPAE